MINSQWKSVPSYSTSAMFDIQISFAPLAGIIDVTIIYK